MPDLEKEIGSCRRGQQDSGMDSFFSSANQAREACRRDGLLSQRAKCVDEDPRINHKMITMRLCSHQSVDDVVN